MYQINVYTLNLYNVIYQLHLNKYGNKIVFLFQRTKQGSATHSLKKKRGKILGYIGLKSFPATRHMGTLMPSLNFELNCYLGYLYSIKFLKKLLR